jgi:hypothetical protein
MPGLYDLVRIIKCKLKKIQYQAPPDRRPPGRQRPGPRALVTPMHYEFNLCNHLGRDRRSSTGSPTGPRPRADPPACYYVTWHMQDKLAPMLFKDDDPAAPVAWPSPVAPRWPLALGAGQGRHQAHRRWQAGVQPRHLTRGPGRHHHRQPHPARRRPARLHRHHHPTPLQRRAFEFLGVSHRLGHA